MGKLRFNLRVFLAFLALAGAAGFLYFAQTDHVPHDKESRVEPDVFWAAVARPNVAQRPTNIVVYPVHLGVQLVTCTGHPPNGDSVDRYFYVRVAPGEATVETKLRGMGIAFRTPWWDSGLMRFGPWVCVEIAVILLIYPVVVGLLKIASQAAAAPVQIEQAGAKITEADLEKVRELDSALESALSASKGQEPAPAATPSVAPGAPRVLTGGPVEAVQAPPEEQKDYRGEYYPVAHPNKQQGFTLVELLVVIGIIGVLIALLLPTLSGARHDANQIACAANLRSIGQILAIYEVQNDGLIPASYSYHGQEIVNGQQEATDTAYVHWSYYLYNKNTLPNSALLCPELDGGGLPPTNTTDDNRLPGQLDDTPGAIDDQAPRMAYTLNEALSPRNKFALGFQNAVRVYQFVHASSIPHASSTILATEWAPNGAQVGAAGGTAGFYVYSHRPVHGFVGLDGTLEMYLLQPGVGYRRVTAADLDPDPASAASLTTRLDWVGRNHGHFTGYPDQRRTNFLYLDGHVECKTIYETLSPFEWGDKFYTLDPNDDLQP